MGEKRNSAAVWQPVTSGLCVPDDPLDSILPLFDLNPEKGFDLSINGCSGFDGFCDEDTSKYSAEDFLDMVLNLPDKPIPLGDGSKTPPPTDSVAQESMSTVTARNAVGQSSPPKSQRWSSSSSSSSEDYKDDEAWLPSTSKKRQGTKCRRKLQEPRPRGQMKKTGPTMVPRPPGMTVDTEMWCRSCGTVETTRWRTGPEGPRTLCNACGLQIKAKVREPPNRRPAKKASCARIRNNSDLCIPEEANVVRRIRSVAVCMEDR